jgi:hypothetical protein
MLVQVTVFDAKEHELGQKTNLHQQVTIKVVNLLTRTREMGNLCLDLGTG